MTFRTDATIDRVETGRLLQWRARDRQKQLRGSRLVEPTGSASSRFTEMVEGHLLGPLRALEPLVAWLLQRQATADLRLQAAQMAAGHDEVRGDDPGQKGENSGPVV